MAKLRYLDLFAGAGGLSEGFMRAGFTPVSHVEMDAAACYTLKTRLAYKWLLNEGKSDIYDSYLRGEIILCRSAGIVAVYRVELRNIMG